MKELYSDFLTPFQLYVVYFSELLECDFWSWFPQVKEYIDLARQMYRSWICHRVPEHLWTNPLIQKWECDVIVYPETWHLRRTIAAIYAFDWWFASHVFLVLLIGIPVYFLIHFFQTRKEFLRRDCWIGFRWWMCWLTNATVEGTRFCPSEFGGEADGYRWSTSSDGIITWFDGTTTSSMKRLPVANRTCLIAMLPTKIETIRTGYFIQQKWTPVGFSEPRMEAPVLATGEYLTAMETDNEITTVYCSRANTHSGAALTASTWDTVMNALKSAARDTTPYSVGAIVRRFYPQINKDRLSEYQSVIAAKWNAEKCPDYVLNETLPEQTLQFVGDRRDDPDAPWKATGRGVMPPFCTEPDTMPAKGYQAGISAVTSRLDNCRNPVRHYQQVVLTYCAEFVDRVVRRRIQPWTLDDVIDHQDGKLQKIRNAIAKWVAFSWLPTTEVKAMVKIESLANHNFIRNISTLPAEFNLSLGSYMLAAAEYMKAEFEWYGAGKTPRAIAERICDMADGAPMDEHRIQWLCAADVSKMDAAKNPSLTAWLTTRIYTRLFGLEDDELITLRKAEASASAATAEGIPYNVGASQLSGSACTTIDNTITNAFISYVAHRIQGLTEDVSFQSLGIYVGDDSVSYNTKESVEEAGRVLGYKIEAEMIRETDNIPFLSRFFYDAWEGGTSSVQDPVRLLRKLHLSISPTEITTQQAAANKARGIHELDPSIDFYRELYITIRRITGKTGDAMEGLGWMTRQFVSMGGWPTDGRANEMWDHYTSFNQSVYIDWLAGVRTWTQFMKGPSQLVFTESKRKAPIMVNPLDPTDQLPDEAATDDPPPPQATVGENAEDRPGASDAARMEKSAVAQIDSMVTEERRQEARAAGAQQPLVEEERTPAPPPAQTRRERRFGRPAPNPVPPELDPFQNMGTFRPAPARGGFNQRRWAARGRPRGRGGR
ncbi:RNA-dependent RNA polymerase [Le Blanc nodavirus]|uniref:RNA-dependent RNA polymerase n=1 Tax=Le Blanc nodavirus TaxID=1241918 RepID=UPI00028B04E5|nr:RNA-dependent RNA polymerase [Le Blanc nodavirus]AFU90716.1 RNA-dependent RNA polymerase [Le Blanc nodavirus]